MKYGTSRPTPEMIVHSETPLNAEPTLERLRASYVTAQTDLYIRSHGNIPDVDPGAYRLRVDGQVATPLDLSIEDLRSRFPRKTVQAVMQCAGNRRGDMLQVRPVSGDPWSAGAIGNAHWTGIALGDLLRSAGVDEEADLHVAFNALDHCEADGEKFNYGVSIPMHKALSAEVLLCFEMNGEPLTPEHGFPIRAVVPGYAGVRSAKWLAEITVQVHPSDAKPQARDYKLFPPAIREETADWEQGITINEMPLNAAICEPLPYARLAAGRTSVRGWATVSGRDITRVDVSMDGGRNWHQAMLRHDIDAPWSWTFWEVMLDLTKGEHELVVRAWDSAGQTQPALPDDTWNFKGYLNAAWHRIRVQVG